ncbi:hypothetical protein GCM10009756_19490 [Pseudokineococcus marinus]
MQHEDGRPRDGARQLCGPDDVVALGPQDEERALGVGHGLDDGVGHERRTVGAGGGALPQVAAEGARELQQAGRRQGDEGQRDRHGPREQPGARERGTPGRARGPGWAGHPGILRERTTEREGSRPIVTRP